MKIFKTPRNVFGLFRQYRSEKPPPHDPEEILDLEALSEEPCLNAASSSTLTPETADSFGPYPNRSSFLLGDWYWSHGAQKSQESFRELLNIVGDPDFQPGDVRDTKWKKINAQLGSNDFRR